MNGQLLAKYLVVPDILRKKYTLTVDVHNNVGNWAKTRFIFSQFQVQRLRQLLGRSKVRYHGYPIFILLTLPVYSMLLFP